MSAGVLVYLAGGTDDILSFAGVDFCKRESWYVKGAQELSLSNVWKWSWALWLL